MNPGFVLDASVALSWCFADQGTPGTAALLTRLEVESAIVPSLWFLEVTNVLAAAERRRRITAAKLRDFLDQMQEFEIQVDDEGPRRAFHQLLGLCREHGVSGYDAVYLDLSLRRHLPLATLDDRLRRAVGQAGGLLEDL